MIYEGYLVRVKAANSDSGYYYAALQNGWTPSDPRMAHIYRTETEAQEEVKFRDKWYEQSSKEKWEYKKITIKIED